MRKGEIAGYLLAVLIIASFAIKPILAQDRPDFFVYYGTTDGSALDVGINDWAPIPVYMFTPEDVYAADCHLCLGTRDLYVVDHRSGYIISPPCPFGEDSFFDTTYGSPPNPEGWSSQSFFGLANILECDPPWIHFDVAAWTISFCIRITDDETIIGDTVDALGSGMNPFQGPSNAGDTLGGEGYDVIESFSLLHILGGFIEGTVIDEWSNPVEDVSVTDENAGGVCTTDLNGFYRMAVSPDTHSFSFSHPYYVDTTISEIVIIHEQTTELNVTLFEISIGIDDNLTFIPNKYTLSQNYPNPFNITTSIAYTIPDRQYVELKIYDILGNEIVTLVNEQKQAGKHSVEFNASRLASGIYFYSVKTGDYNHTKRMVLLK